MQSNLTRALVALAAVAVVVVAFVVLKGDEETDDGSANGTVTAEQADTGEGSGNDSKPAGDGGGGKPEKPAEPAVPEIVVKGGEPEGGVAELEFEKGDEVRFVVRSDAADEIHVHGYDVYADVPAGGKAEVEFPAEIDGIFEVELHDTAAQIAELTVSP